MAETGENRPHLVIRQLPDALPYGSRGFPATKTLPPRDRTRHGQYLREKIQAINSSADDEILEQRRRGLTSGCGIQVQFLSEPGFELKLQSLELRGNGIELLSVVEREGRAAATVFVPEGKLRVFLQKIEEYMERDTDRGAPRNRDLVESISEIRRATLEALWTDDVFNFPETGDAIWWEVWLRKGGDSDYTDFLERNSEALGLRLGSQRLDFVERRVVLVWGTSKAMSASLHLLVGIAELRAARDTADLYSSMSPVDQAEWVEQAVRNLQPLPDDAAAVCILDTGLNPGHPLLAPLSTPATVQSVDLAWGSDDHHGHGTSMAGLAAFGDLTYVLQVAGPVNPRCFIESCKILPPVGANDPKLYGAITRDAVSLAEIAAPQRRRVIQTAVTADGASTGRPSSWSAAIDAISSGAEDDNRRLFVLSVGNVLWNTHCAYPTDAELAPCEDPSQSWNSLAVGAYTEKVTLDASKWPNESPLAPVGGLSPETRTSLLWTPRWPNRPDIVMEGGNLSVNSATNFASDLDELALLTTGHQHLSRSLVVSRGTSPSGAQAAGLAAELMTAYPEFWPETVRGLIVHSSDWTDAMQATVSGVTGKAQVRHLLRTCGWGCPNRERAFHSAASSLTLVAQGELRPFRKERGSGVAFRDMHLHRLPWPVDALRELFDCEVELRVTLSYFIEPSPGERGYGGPFTYASHGLRFALQAQDESQEDFTRRVNVAARDEDDDGSYRGEAEGWLLGPTLRNRGSLHSDRWRGTAVELAGRSCLAVYPIGGWWRYRPHLERVNKGARYALILSIHSPAATVDLYSAIEQKIAVSIPIEV